jgi:hypothetical protein
MDQDTHEDEVEAKRNEKSKGPEEQDDYVFPALDTKGRVRIRNAMTLPRVQEYLNVFTNNSVILGSRNGKFTTHCFRRGGAQHRFMFAKKKWSLKALKWWGGWSESEREGAIMRYLLDEYSKYESGYGDMFSPDRDDSRDTQFIRDYGTSSGEVINQRTLAFQLQSLESSIKALDQRISSSKREQREESRHLLNDIGGMIIQELGKTITNLLGSQLVGAQVQQAPQSSIPVIKVACVAQPQELSEATGQRAPGPRIPNVRTWKDCITQWDEGDLENGLTLPLRHWTKSMRKTDPSRYSQRKLITNEYYRLNQSDKNMEEVHGMELTAVKRLISSIRSVRRVIKEEREARRTGERESDEEEDENDDEEDEEDEGDEAPSRKRYRKN